MAKGFHFYIDWNGDGDFSDTSEDVTADFQKLVTLRGRDSDLDRAIGGQASLTLRDTSGKYIRENTSSPLYGVIKPGVLCQLSYEDGEANTWYIFTGHLDDVIPDVYNKSAYVPILDGFSELNRMDGNLSVQLNKKSGQLFGTILDSVAWPAALRTLSAGVDTYPMAYIEASQKALRTMQAVEQSEFGFLYMGVDGNLTWEDRHYRLSQTRCTTSQWTCDGSKYQRIKPLNPLKSVKNYVVLECQPKTKSASLSTLWTLQEKASIGNSPMLAAGETKTFWAGFADANGTPQIAGDVVTPAATTDYTGNSAADGSGTDKTSDLSVTSLVADTNLWASGAKIAVKNNGSTSVYLTKLQVRGKIFVNEGKLLITSPATAPASSRREFRVSVPFSQTSGVLQGIADHIRTSYENPNPCYEIDLIAKSSDFSDEVSQHIRERKLSDRIHVECSEYGIDGDFYLEKVRNEITPWSWKASWTVSRTDPWSYWILGTSALGTGTRLAY